ncbi:hypothetical protein Tco_0379604 [Tanacetum coccineum]
MITSKLVSSMGSMLNVWFNKLRVQPRIRESVSIVSSSADSIVYLMSKVDGTMSLRRLKAVDTKLLLVRDHLRKFDEKADDGFFLSYSPVAKAFRVFNIKRQEMEETLHVTFSEDDEAISQSNTEGDAINFNENRSFPDDEFLKPRSKVTQCPGNIEYFPYIPAYENTIPTDSPILQDSVSPEEPPEFTNNGIPHSPVPQDRWLREKHIELVNIIGEHLTGITTRSRVRDSKAASAHECLYFNFLSEMEPKKLFEALEEEG